MAVLKWTVCLMASFNILLTPIGHTEELSPEKQKKLNALIGNMPTKQPKITKESFLKSTKVWAEKMEGYFKSYRQYATAYINDPSDKTVKPIEKLEMSIFADLLKQPMPPEGSSKSDKEMQDLAAQVGSAYSDGHGAIKALVGDHHAVSEAKQGALVDKMNSRFKSFNTKIPAVRKALGLKSDREVASKPNQNWYEGGNLHGQTIKDWKNATTHNRLATAADFISKITGALDKEKSIELEACLTSFASGADNRVMNQKVAEIGTLCAVQLGYIQQ